MNKRANLTDTVYAPIYILVIGITMFLAVYIWTQTSHAFQNMPYTNSNLNQSIQTAINNITPTFNTFDYMVPFIIGVLLIISLVSAFRRGASIMYIGISIVFWILALILTTIYSEIFSQFSSAFPETATSFPILVYVMANIKWVVLGWLFLISVVMFTRTKKEEQQIASSEQVFTR